MNPAPEKSKSRGLIVTIAAITGVVGYVFAVFLPGQRSMARQRQELRDKQQFIAAAAMNTAEAATLEEQMKAARQHVDRWRTHSAPESVGANLFGEIAALATESGVSLQRLTPQDPAALATLKQQTLDLKVEGNFSQLLEFLQGIESRPETIWVPRFELQSSAEDGKKVQCALSLVVFADNPKNSG